MNYRKIFLIALINSLVALYGYSQIAELTTIISNPKEEPATGMVLVNGQDSTWSKTLEDGSAYFILKNQTGIEEVLQVSDIKVYPNPVRNNELNISLPYGMDDGYVEFFEITGKHLGRVALQEDNSLTFQVKPGIVFYRAFYNEKSHFGRIVNLGDFMRVKINSLPEPLKPLKLFTLLDDEYNILFTDPEGDLEAVVVENVYIPVTTHRILHLFPEFSTKTSWIDFETNTQTKISISSTIELESFLSESGNESVTLEEKYSFHDGLDLFISLTGEYTDTANIELHVEPGERYTIVEQREASYFLRVIGNGTTYSVYHGDEMIGNEAVGNQITFKSFEDRLLLRIVTVGDGLVTDEIEEWVGKGAVEFYRSLDEMGDTYEHTVVANVFSDKDDKVIKDGTDGYVVKANGDTLWAQVTGEQFSRTFTTVNEYEDVKVGIKNIPGHQEVSSDETVGSLLTTSLTASAMEYQANLEVDVVDLNDEAVVNALVIHGSLQGNTDASGNILLNGVTLNTNVFNEFVGPVATVTSVEATAQSIDFEKVTHFHDIDLGDNYEKIQVGGQSEYTHNIHGIVTSSIGGKNIKDGSIAWYVLASSPNDTVKTNVEDESFDFSFISSSPNENITVGVKEIPGHQAVENSYVAGEDLNVTLIAPGLQYLQTANVHVEDDQGNPLQYVEALVGGQTGYTDENGNVTIADIVLQTNQFNEFTSYNETASISPTDQSEGFNTQTKTYLAQPGAVDIEFVVEVNTVYSHELTIEVESSIFGKTIKDGSIAWFVLASSTADTIKKETLNEKAVFKFTTGNASEDIMVGVKLIPGHMDVQDNLTIAAAQTAYLTATGLGYDAILPLLVKNRKTDLPIEGAIIAGIGTAQISSATGQATLNDDNLDTDIYNLPLSEYRSDVTINKSGFNTFSGEWAYHDGTNALRTVRLDPINEAPTVSGIPDIVFDEDESYTGLQLDDYSNDDFTALIDLTWTYSGNTNVVVSIGTDHVVTFTAAEDWSGSETITFTVQDDGGLTDSQAILVTVNPVNDPPYQTNPISDQSIGEGETVSINWTNHADDVDNTYPELTVSIASPLNFTYEVTGNNIEITPVVGFSGTIQDIVINVSDGEFDVDLDPFDIAVAQNQSPIIGDIPDIVFNEDETYTGLDLDDYVTDETADFDLSWTFSGNVQVIVAIGSNHVVTFLAQPNWFGEENVTFTVEDELGATSSKTILVRVLPVNDPPHHIIPIPDQNLGEGETLIIPWTSYAGDIDNTNEELTLNIASSSNFSWVQNGLNLEITPDPGIGLIENIIVIVSDLEPLSIDLEPFDISIQQNQSPVVGDLPSITFNEDESDSSLSLDGYVTDDETPDNAIIWTYSGNTNVLVSIGTDRVVTFTSTQDWFGSEIISLTAEDEGGLTDSKDVVVTVLPVNDAPVETQEIPDQTIEMNTFLELDWTPFVSDVDNANADLVLNIVTLPNASFEHNGDLIKITPDTDFFGTIENIIINVSDGDLNVDLSAFNLVVTNSNLAPVLTDIADIEFDEDETDSSLDLDEIVTDDNTLDADIIWTYSGNTEVTVSIDPTTHVVTFGATADWNGEEVLTFTAEDEGGLTSSKTVLVRVLPVNDPPHEIDPIGDRTIEINTFLEIDWTLYAGDIDNTSAELTLDIVSLSNASFLRTGDMLKITPDTDFVGVIENIVINVADAEFDIDLTSFNLTVTDDNTSPVVSELPDITFNEDETDSSLDLDDYVTDDKTAPADIVWTYSGNTEVTISIDPTTHVVTFGATADWNGNETVTLTAEDEGGLQTGESLLVTVLPVNDPPHQILAIDDQTIDKNTYLEMDWTPYAGDIDNTNPELTLTIATLPNAVFSHTGDLFRITPTTDFTGTISNIIINVSDGDLNTDLDAFNLIVEATNSAPEMTDLPDISFPEDGSDSSLDLDDYVSDDNTSDADMTWTYSGNTEVTVSIDPTSHVVTFGATPDWNGNENVTFTAEDEEGLTDSRTLNVEVTPVNDAPIQDNPISEVTINVNTFYEFDWTVHASDIDNLNSELILTIESLTNATYLQTGDMFKITPDTDWTGTISGIVINVSDGDLSVDLDPFNLIVVDVNSAPEVGDIPDITFPEDETDNTLDLDSYVTDDNTVDGDIIWAYSGQTNVTVSIDPVSHVVTFGASLNWNGSESITFTAQDEGGLTDNKTILVTVTPVNDAPVFLPTIPDQTIWPLEQVVLDLKPYFSDVDNATLNYTLTGLDNGTHSITNGVLTITPTAGWTGTDDGLKIEADDGILSAFSNLFSMTVSDSEKATVTFEFRSVTNDQILSGGIYTMKYKKVGESTVQEASGSNPTLVIDFDRGETYDLQAFWSLSLDTNFDYPGAFMFLKRPGDIEAFEQRTGVDSGDTDALVTFNDPTETIYVYKFMWDFPFSEVYYFVVTGDNGQTTGTTKFDTDDVSAPVWWDTNTGLAPTATQSEWIDELFSEIKSLPHVYSTFPYLESASQPSGHHVWIHKTEQVEGNPIVFDHTTTYDGTHAITEAKLTYEIPLNYGDRGSSYDERNFKLEILKAILNLNDGFGVPPFLENTGSGWVLSEKGKKIISTLYLAKVGSYLDF